MYALHNAKIMHTSLCWRCLVSVDKAICLLRPKKNHLTKNKNSFKINYKKENIRWKKNVEKLISFTRSTVCLQNQHDQFLCKIKCLITIFYQNYLCHHFQIFSLPIRVPTQNFTSVSGPFGCTTSFAHVVTSSEATNRLKLLSRDSMGPLLP